MAGSACSEASARSGSRVTVDVGGEDALTQGVGRLASGGHAQHGGVSQDVGREAPRRQPEGIARAALETDTGAQDAAGVPGTRDPREVLATEDRVHARTPLLRGDDAAVVETAISRHREVGLAFGR